MVMNNLFEGLLLYEITLLILGVILFLILSIGLLFYIIKKEPLMKLLMFFFIPIVMIGYPSITQVTISNDKIELSKLQKEVIENPRDSVAIEKMEQLTQKLEKRATTPDDLIQVSTSNLLLGNNVKAVSLADQALTKDNTAAAAMDIKRLATVQEQIQVAPENMEDTAKTDSIIRDIKVTQEMNQLKPYLIQKSRRSLELNRVTQ